MLIVCVGVGGIGMGGVGPLRPAGSRYCDNTCHVIGGRVLRHRHHRHHHPHSQHRHHTIIINIASFEACNKC